MATNSDPDGTAYSPLVDSSGNGFNFTASSSGTLVKTGVAPTGLRGILFPGGMNNDYFRLSDGTNMVSPSEFFVVMVGKIVASVAPDQPFNLPAMWTDVTGVAIFGVNDNTVTIGCNVNDGLANNVASVSSDITSWHTWVFWLAAGVLHVSQDGGAESTIATGNINGLTNIIRMGANYNASAHFNGYLGAFYMVPNAPSLANRTAAFNYFKGIWGTP